MITAEEEKRVFRNNDTLSIKLKFILTKNKTVTELGVAKWID